MRGYDYSVGIGLFVGIKFGEIVGCPVAVMAGKQFFPFLSESRHAEKQFAYRPCESKRQQIFGD